MRRVMVPQRDAIGRLARREFPMISDEMAYRFRDVYDHVVRLTEEAMLFQDRVTGIFEVNLSTVSHRLNQVMKVLTVMSTIFLPLTGADRHVGHEHRRCRTFPAGRRCSSGGSAASWSRSSRRMLAFFRRNKWI